jgi:hypothetical protein
VILRNRIIIIIRDRFGWWRTNRPTFSDRLFDSFFYRPDLLKQKQKEIKEKKERKINSVRGIESIILAMGENMIHRCRIYRPRIVSPA